MNLRDIYEKAATVIVRNGHHKGFFYDTATPPGASDDAPVCMVGAVSLVMTGNPVPPEYLCGDLGDVLVSLAKRVESFIDEDVDDDPVERIATWNDREERTVDEVVDMLRTTAKAVA